MKRILFLTTVLFTLAVVSHAGSPDRDRKVQVSGFDITKLPKPFCDDYPHFKEIYDKAWQLAWDHITYRDGMPQSPFIDEAFSKDADWIWDTQFMLLYWRYASHIGDWIKTNNNFYKPIHDGVSTPAMIHILDNPPLFAWSEYLYYKISGDKAHLKQLLDEDRYLQRHFEWFDTVSPGYAMARSVPTWLHKVENGYLWEGGRSGMDNTPRGRTYAPVKEDRPNNPNMLWIDAIAQQALSADNISDLFKMNGEPAKAKIWAAKRDSIAEIINRLYWDADDEFYYDIDCRDHSFFKVATPASYWVMLSGASSKERAKALALKATMPDWFGADAPFTTLRPTDPNYGADGNYWRGSMWLPTSYMAVKALDRYGYHDIAHASAVRIIERQYQTYKNYSPSTIWECYSPSEYKPTYRHDYKSYVRQDFCGWSALGPISLFIEDVLGFYDIDASTNTIHWNRTLEKPHGIRDLHFGDIKTDIVWDGKRVIATTNKPYTLIVNGKKMKIR